MADTITSPSQTDKLCPFAGMSISDTTVTGIKCIKEDCQLWIKNRGEVGTVPSSSSTDIFTSLLSLIFGDDEEDEFSKFTGLSIYTADQDKISLLSQSDILTDNGMDSQQDGGRCGAQVADYNENMFRLMHHMHKNHLHPSSHVQVIDSVDEAGGLAANVVPQTMQLAMEFQTNEDIDGDGKIYGKDFVIKQNDNTPPALSNLINPYRTRPVTEIDWEDYKDRKFYPQIKSIYPRFISDDQGYLMRLTGSFFSGNMAAEDQGIADDDSEFFKIQIVGPNGTGEEGGSDVYVPPNEVWVINDNLLYFKIPVNPGGGYAEASSYVGHTIKITNYGNTFSDVGWFSWLLNTGGTTVVPKAFKYTVADGDADIQLKLQEELNSYLNQ